MMRERKKKSMLINFRYHFPLTSLELAILCLSVEDLDTFIDLTLKTIKESLKKQGFDEEYIENYVNLQLLCENNRLPDFAVYRGVDYLKLIMRKYGGGYYFNRNNKARYV